MAIAYNNIGVDNLETISPFAVVPWVKRLKSSDGSDAKSANTAEGAVARIAISASGRNGLVGVGGVVQLVPAVTQVGSSTVPFSFTLGARTEQNPTSGELAAAAHATEKMLPAVRNRSINIYTRNKAAVQMMSAPRQQSGQSYLETLYKVVQTQRGRGNSVEVTWIPACKEHELLSLAKAEAWKATA